MHVPHLSDNPFRLFSLPGLTPLSTLTRAQPRASLRGVLGEMDPAPLLPRLRDPVQRTVWRLMWPLHDEGVWEELPPREDHQIKFLRCWLLAAGVPDPALVGVLVQAWRRLEQDDGIRTELQRFLESEGGWPGALELAYRRAREAIIETQYGWVRKLYEKGSPQQAAEYLEPLTQHWLAAELEAPSRAAFRGVSPLQNLLPPFHPEPPREEELRRRVDLDVIRLYNRLGLAWPAHRAAEVELRERRPERALGLLRAARQKHPQVAALAALEGTTLLMLEQEDEALRAFEEALARDPSLTRAWTGKSMVMSARQLPDQQRECYRRALELEPQDAVMWYCSALLEAHQGQFQLARDQVETSLGLDPGSADAWFLHAHALNDLDAPAALVEASLHQAARHGHQGASALLSPP